MVQVFNRYKFSGRSLGFGLLILDFKLSVSQMISSLVVVQLDLGFGFSGLGYLVLSGSWTLVFSDLDGFGFSGFLGSWFLFGFG